MPVIFVCPSCRHRVSVPKRFVGANRNCPACGENVHVPEIADALFLELARGLGRPSPEVLEHYEAMQRERASRGRAVGLFQLLCDNGVLTLGEESRFRRLAQEAHDREPRSEADAPLAGSEEAQESGEPPAAAGDGEALLEPDPDLLAFAGSPEDAELVNTLAPPEPDERLELERQRLDLERQRVELERQRLDLERRAQALGGASPIAVPEPPAPPAPTSTRPPIGKRRPRRR